MDLALGHVHGFGLLQAGDGISQHVQLLDLVSVYKTLLTSALVYAAPVCYLEYNYNKIIGI